MRTKSWIILFAFTTTLCGGFLLFSSQAFAARIAYQGGQPLGGGFVGIEITDEIQGTPFGVWPLPTLQVDGNVFNIYASPQYSPGPTNYSYFTYVQVGPLAIGDYQVNFYTKDLGL